MLWLHSIPIEDSKGASRQLLKPCCMCRERTSRGGPSTDMLLQLVLTIKNSTATHCTDLQVLDTWHSSKTVHLLKSTSDVRGTLPKMMLRKWRDLFWAVACQFRKIPRQTHAAFSDLLDCTVAAVETPGC